MNYHFTPALLTRTLPAARGHYTPMELVVRKNDLLRELQLFQGIVERKNTIPILANVLIEAKGDEVRMLATDLEVALRSRCAASVAKSGSLTLPAKKLYEIVKALPEIGRSFGGKHHSTVIHSIKKVEDLRRKDGDFNNRIGTFLQAFK